MAALNYRDPILVATTDGVGTKLKLAQEMGRHETIGVDLVAMCVNDLVVQGAEPLFFLDYFAVGRLDPMMGKTIIAGIAKACREVGCGLIGGETAEMPGLYQGGDYDLAGFSVGAVERDKLLPRRDIAAGDIVLGIASTGAHSNGYSLIRHIVANAGARYDAPAPFDPTRTLGEILLTPTRLYVRPALAAARAGLVKAYAHITGGGLLENIPRILPDHLAAQIDQTSWPHSSLFDWLQKAGSVDALEMLRVFNCGIGFVAVLAPDQVEAVEKIFADSGDGTYRIGVVAPRLDPAQGVIVKTP